VLLWNSRHPAVEGNRSLRKDSLAEERGSAAQEGHRQKETKGRQLSRYASLRSIISSPADHKLMLPFLCALESGASTEDLLGLVYQTGIQFFLRWPLTCIKLEILEQIPPHPPMTNKFILSACAQGIGMAPGHGIRRPVSQHQDRQEDGRCHGHPS
jgi:hypothetical protein